MSDSVYTPFLRRFTDERALESQETVDLYNTAYAEYLASPIAKDDIVERISNHCATIITEQVDLPLYVPLGAAFDACQQAVIALESTVTSFPIVDWSATNLSMQEAADLRKALHAKRQFIANPTPPLELLATTLVNLFGGIGQQLPAIPWRPEYPTTTTPLIELVEDPNRLVDSVIGTICTDEHDQAGLFTTLRIVLTANVCEASGVQYGDHHKRKLITAATSKLPPVELSPHISLTLPFLTCS